MRWLTLDIATAALDNVDQYLDPVEVSVPGNYKKPETIAAYLAEQTPKLEQERRDRAGLDFDLARITAIGFASDNIEAKVDLCRDLDTEISTIHGLGDLLRDTGWQLITFNGPAFDLPMLMSRARWLGVPFPQIVIAPAWKSSVVDMMDVLAYGDRRRHKSLDAHVRRHGWDLPKTLSGAEEARIFEHGRWDDLAASVRRDVEATARLAKWCKIIA